MNKFTALLGAGMILAGCVNIAPPDFQEFSARFTGERTELYHGEEKWDFEKFLLAEMAENPEMECADLVKFCCQAAFGIDAFSDNSRENFFKDFNNIQADRKVDLIRVTSPDTARVNIAAWKAAGLHPEWLFRMSAAESEFDDSVKKMDEYINTAAKLIPECNVKFSAEEFRKTAEKCRNANHKHLTHSKIYQQKNPEYRLISSRYFHAIPVLKAASKIKSGEVPGIIAIDGRSASGKTTLANQLKIILDAQVIHMDDFFLPPSLRTKMRYEEAGGNLHYERFKEEVLPNLKKNSAFSYRIFDCKKLDFNGNRMIWANSKWRIVEGAYSHHRNFGNYADLKVFYDISPAEQIRRITGRNGEKAAENFKKKWIPMEEKYIRTFSVDKNADIIIR